MSLTTRGSRLDSPACVGRLHTPPPQSVLRGAQAELVTGRLGQTTLVPAVEMDALRICATVLCSWSCPPIRDYAHDFWLVEHEGAPADMLRRPCAPQECGRKGAAGPRWRVSAYAPRSTPPQCVAVR